MKLGTLALTALVTLSTALIGCGRNDRIYPDLGVGATMTIESDPIIVIDDGQPLLPPGFFDQSVNRAETHLALDGDSSLVIRLATSADVNPPGAFNGTGNGNLALLGVGDHSGRALSTLRTLTFDARTYLGTLIPTVILLVDLQCDGSAVRTLIAQRPSLHASSTALNSGYKRFYAGIADRVWQVDGSSIVDPDDENLVLVSSTRDSASSDLTSLLGVYPNACLRNTASGGSTLPKNLPTAAVLFALGIADSPSHEGAFVSRIVLGSDIYQSEDWMEL